MAITEEKIHEVIQAWAVARKDLEMKLTTMNLNDPDRESIIKTIEETEEKINKLTQIHPTI